MKIRFLVLFTLLLAGSSFTQTAGKIDSLIISGKHLLQAAVNSWEEPNLIQARGYFERLVPDETYPWLVQYYVALADYRLVNFYNSRKNTEAAKNYLEDGIQRLDAAIARQPDFPDAHSLLSSLLGIKIGLTPWLGITLGAKSAGEMETARKLAPENPRNELISGISAFFTPRLFGGGQEKAQAALERAVTLFATTRNDNPIWPDWGHDEAHAWLGLIFQESASPEKAKFHFDEALKINPQNNWVKYVLLPKYQKQIEATGK